MSHIIEQLLNLKPPRFNKTNMIAVRKHIDSVRQLVDILMLTYSDLPENTLSAVIAITKLEMAEFAMFYNTQMGNNMNMPSNYFDTINIMAYELWLSLETCENNCNLLKIRLEFLKKSFNEKYNNPLPSPTISDEYNELYEKIKKKRSVFVSILLDALAASEAFNPIPIKKLKK